MKILIIMTRAAPPKSAEGRLKTARRANNIDEAEDKRDEDVIDNESPTADSSIPIGRHIVAPEIIIFAKLKQGSRI